MHDTCNAANAAAREIARRKTISGQDYFTPDVWNSMGPDIQETLDFLCGNHTRQVPVAAYIRLVDKWVGEVLGEKMSLINQQVNPRLRLETKSSTLRHSIQKQTHCGWGTYAKGDGERFKHNFVDVLTAMRGRGKKRKEVTVEERFYRVVAVSYSDQNEELGGVWGVDAVPVDRFGAVPDAHRTCSVTQCGPCCTQHVKRRSLVFYGLQSETEVDESVAKMVADYKGRFGEPVAADPQAGV